MGARVQIDFMTDAEKYEHIRKYPLPDGCRPKWLEKLEKSNKNKRKKPKSYSVRFLKSSEWKDLRRYAINYYGRICMCCQSNKNIQVDHIKPKSKYPELALNFENLQILCWECNRKKCNRDETDYRTTKS